MVDHATSQTLHAPARSIPGAGQPVQSESEYAQITTSSLPAEQDLRYAPEVTFQVLSNTGELVIATPAWLRHPPRCSFRGALDVRPDTTLNLATMAVYLVTLWAAMGLALTLPPRPAPVCRALANGRVPPPEPLLSTARQRVGPPANAVVAPVLVILLPRRPGLPDDGADDRPDCCAWLAPCPPATCPALLPL